MGEVPGTMVVRGMLQLELDEQEHVVLALDALEHDRVVPEALGHEILEHDALELDKAFRCRLHMVLWSDVELLEVVWSTVPVVMGRDTLIHTREQICDPSYDPSLPPQNSAVVLRCLFLEFCGGLFRRSNIFHVLFSQNSWVSAFSLHTHDRLFAYEISNSRMAVHEHWLSSFARFAVHCLLLFPLYLFHRNHLHTSPQQRTGCVCFLIFDIQDYILHKKLR